MAGAAPTADDTEAAPQAEPAAKPKSKLGLIIGLVVVLAAAGGGAFFFMGHKSGGSAASSEEGHGGSEHEGGEGGEAAKLGNANYLALTPSFTVNLEDEEANRYLQVEMEVRASDSHVLDEVKVHTPRIRNAILLLLGQQHYHDLATRQGKEALQAKVLAEIQNILKAETGKPGIEAVYFTSFVMQ